MNWIKVEDGLPDVCKDLICMCKMKHTFDRYITAWYHSMAEGWFSFDEQAELAIRSGDGVITHWAYITEPEDES